MIKITDPKQCCGCTACASICSHNAITMQPDNLGFLYPIVDNDKCVDCGLCEKVCAFNDNYDKSQNLQKLDTYAVRHKDIHEVETSRSGAAFIAISDYILDNGGIVYGVGYKNHFRVVHKRATTKEERNEFKGSKYVQSDINGVFHQIKKDLNDGLTVLFSGTPCQTAGLNSYIGKKLRKNLILVDIVCHGVPSPFIWSDYLKYIEKKQGSKIYSVNFRDKNKFGWKAHKETFRFINKEISTRSFTFLFYKNIMMRHSCGVCHYCNTCRPSDITLADFWGWEKTNFNLNADNKGVSLLLINTPKGQEIFNNVKDMMNTMSVQLQKALQPNLCHPSKVHPQSTEFERDYITHGIEYVLKKYGDVGMQNWHKRFINTTKDFISKILIKIKQISRINKIH